MWISRWYFKVLTLYWFDFEIKIDFKLFYQTYFNEHKLGPFSPYLKKQQWYDDCIKHYPIHQGQSKIFNPQRLKSIHRTRIYALPRTVSQINCQLVGASQLIKSWVGTSTVAYPGNIK